MLASITRSNSLFFQFPVSDPHPPPTHPVHTNNTSKTDRGYGCSTGVPAPDRVKQDGESMALHLRSERRVQRLVFHGESIGGMVAAHVAARLADRERDLLVCDRTFASLDATAGRLMGSWASLGLRYVGLYRTDVASDYLSARCHKVMLQDPADEIIHNSASAALAPPPAPAPTASPRASVRPLPVALASA